MIILLSYAGDIVAVSTSDTIATKWELLFHGGHGEYAKRVKAF